MGKERDRALPGWRIVLPFFLLAAALYAGLSLLTEESLVRAVVGGLIWAVLFVPAFLWVMAKINAKAREKRGFANGDGPVSSQSLHVQAAPSEVLDIVVKEVERMPRAKVVHSDQRAVDVQMGMTFGSWGERVQVEAIDQEGGTYVTVISRPALRMTLFDYGKGQENVRRLVDALKKHGLSA